MFSILTCHFIKQKLKIEKELKECRKNYDTFKKDTAELTEINKKVWMI